MNTLNLSALFSARIFRTPDYQRGYAWDEKQLSELWDDLEEIPIGEDGEYKKHYTGTVFLKETQPNSDEKWYSEEKFYDVVDGQQRLTSISILLFELLNATDTGYCGVSKSKLYERYIAVTNMTGESEIYKFNYSKDDKNYRFLRHAIFENKKEILPVDYENHYTKNLIFAKTFFRDKIKKLSIEEREVLYKKITTSLLFDIRTIENDLDVQAIFETMNNRGKPLSILEKVKNRLIYLTTKLTNPEEDIEKLRCKINDTWENIYTWLAKNPENVLDEDVFLSAHLSLYRKPSEYIFSEKTAETKIFQMFCNKAEKYEEPTVDYTKIEDYILKLSELAPIWYEIHNSKSQIIRKILTLDSRKEIKIFLSAVINEKTKKQEEIFEKTEKILFRNRVPGIWIMDERNMANWAIDIYNKEKDFDELINDIDILLSTNIQNINIVNGFKRLFEYEKGNKGFHRWWCLKYFLFEYDNYLKDIFNESNDKITLDDFDKTSIEHVLPQYWVNNWKSEIDDVIDTLEDENKIHQAIKVIINTLGNLTIMKRSKTCSISNRDFESKKYIYRTGSYNEIAISQYDKWNKFSINKRGKDMLRFLETKVSGLKFSESDMNNILFFDDYLIEQITN